MSHHFSRMEKRGLIRKEDGDARVRELSDEVVAALEEHQKTDCSVRRAQSESS
jgi:hypothetical protein